MLAVECLALRIVVAGHAVQQLADHLEADHEGGEDRAGREVARFGQGQQRGP